MSLLKTISTAKLEDGVKMKEYIRGVRETAGQLAEIGGVKLNKTAVIGFILNGLPESYRYLVVSLESQVQSIGYEDLSARLIDEEKRMMDFGMNIGAGTGSFDGTESDIVKANMAKFAGRVCHQCRQSGHLARDCPERLKNVQCNWCGQFGHKEARCKVKEFQVENSETSKERRNAYFALGTVDSGFTVPPY